MEKQAIIKVEDVSMKFNLSSEKFDSFKEYVIKRLKKQVKFDEFWALKNVSFEVYKGESLGLIGLNGSGKSTMLKLCARFYDPRKGSVRFNGMDMKELEPSLEQVLTWILRQEKMYSLTEPFWDMGVKRWKNIMII